MQGRRNTQQELLSLLTPWMPKHADAGVASVAIRCRVSINSVHAVFRVRVGSAAVLRREVRAAVKAGPRLFTTVRPLTAPWN